jgi:hypothetical protein
MSKSAEGEVLDSADGPRFGVCFDVQSSAGLYRVEATGTVGSVVG